MPAILPPPARLLLEAADPLAPLPAGLLADPGAFATLLADAERHGVLPIVSRKLRSPGQASTAGIAIPAEWGERAMFAAGQSMLLRRQGAQVTAALDAGGVASRIVKGPVFADRLYPHAADRPFTDIDLLIRPDQIGEANRVMAAAGYELPAGLEASAALQEYKWFLAGNSSILVELHGDMVHLPNLRRRLSLDFDRLASVDGGEMDSPPSLLLIAVIHAAGGHKFHRAQLMVDVLQSVRALRSADDEMHAVEAARACGAALEFATVLGVTGQLFGNERAKSLAARASSGLATSLARRLVSPAAIVAAGGGPAAWRSRLQRDAFRWVQRLARVS